MMKNGKTMAKRHRPIVAQKDTMTIFPDVPSDSSSAIHDIVDMLYRERLDSAALQTLVEAIKPFLMRTQKPFEVAVRFISANNPTEGGGGPPAFQAPSSAMEGGLGPP